MQSMRCNCGLTIFCGSGDDAARAADKKTKTAQKLTAPIKTCCPNVNDFMMIGSLNRRFHRNLIGF